MTLYNSTHKYYLRTKCIKCHYKLSTYSLSGRLILLIDACSRRSQLKSLSLRNASKQISKQSWKSNLGLIMWPLVTRQPRWPVDHNRRSSLQKPPLLPISYKNISFLSKDKIGERDVRCYCESSTIGRTIRDKRLEITECIIWPLPLGPEMSFFPEAGNATTSTRSTNFLQSELLVMRKRVLPWDQIVKWGHIFFTQNVLV